MSKRKRKQEDDGEDGESIKKDYRRQRQIVDTFQNSAKQLAHAFKLAKGFERQKLGRRKKNAVREKDEKISQRIDAEVGALKTLEITACARNLLAKSLLKIKAVATNPNLPDDIAKVKPVSTQTAGLNVHARLCNSNPVKQAFPTAIAAIKREFGIRDEVPSKKLKRAKDDAAEKERGRSMSVSSDENKGSEQYADRLASSDDEEEDTNAHSIPRKRRKSGSSDDESLPSDVDVADLERQLEKEGLGLKSRVESRASAFSDEEEEEESESEMQRPKKTAKSTSNFLPVLSMGGYISGSDSDIEDIDDSKPKKNRRGQRARQAIWEKKYGKSAKHLHGQDLKQGWDPKRGAVDSDPRAYKGSKTSRYAKAANALPLGKNRNAEPPATKMNESKKSRDDTGPLHPSWEAAKRAKEKKSEPVKFTGKKISFD